MSSSGITLGLHAALEERELVRVAEAAEERLEPLARDLALLL
jgi:hypothetical protein